MMSEFSIDRASDWDLQAIVNGRSICLSSNSTNINTNTNTNTYTNTYTNTNNSLMMNLPNCYDSWFDSLLEDCCHQNTTFMFVNNLQESNHGGSISNSTQQVAETNSVINFDMYTQSSPHDHTNQKSTSVSCESSRATISKRRKNKHKIIKMVQQAGGDRILTDKWNWRKYGEKVIKGSPYPRSYYRCSYPGGCSARKQVEQSCNDPGLFLITYMEEHTHPYPTRRHSQAGRSAKRFNHSSSTKVVIKKTDAQNTLVRTSTSESSSTNTNNDRVLILQSDQEDDGNNNINAGYVGGNNQITDCYTNRVFEDDFFAGLDYLEGLSMNLYD